MSRKQKPRQTCVKQGEMGKGPSALQNTASTLLETLSAAQGSSGPGNSITMVVWYQPGGPARPIRAVN